MLIIFGSQYNNNNAFIASDGFLFWNQHETVKAQSHLNPNSEQTFIVGPKF